MKSRCMTRKKILLRLVCPAIFFAALLSVKQQTSAQNFEVEKSGKIVWVTSGLGNKETGYHYHTIGWKFSVTQTIDKVTRTATATIYLGNAYSKAKAYAKSGKLEILYQKGYTTKYAVPVGALSNAVGLNLKQGTVEIRADAVIEFYHLDKKGNRKSSHISTTKTDANAYCAKYHFRSNFSGSYSGYFGLAVRQSYYCLTMQETEGIRELWLDGKKIKNGYEVWLKKGEKITAEAKALEGYAFAGWTGIAVSSKEKISVRMPARGVEARASAEPKVYVLRLDGNGGSVVVPRAYKNARLLEKYHKAWGYVRADGDKRYWPSANQKPATGMRAAREGYIFCGFYTQRSRGKCVIGADGTMNVSYGEFKEDVTLYAHWREVVKQDTPKEEPKKEEPPREEPKEEEPPREDPREEEPPQEDPKEEEPPREDPKKEEPPQEDPKKEEPQSGRRKYRLRFVSGKYLDRSEKQGGLSADSVWRRKEFWDFLYNLLKK